MAYDELNPPSQLYYCATPYLGSVSTTTGGKCGQWVAVAVDPNATWTADEMTGQLVYQPSPSASGQLTADDVAGLWAWGLGSILGLWMLGMAVSAVVRVVRMA